MKPVLKNVGIIYGELLLSVIKYLIMTLTMLFGEH